MSQYFNHNESSEQDLYEDLIIECIDFMGTDLYYVPRTLVSKDEVLGEDRLSEFKNKYLIRGYLEQIDNFEGQGAMIQKFGLMMEQSGTFTIPRKVWQTAIGNYGQTILPNRPAEGDLIYWPTNGGLFEIKFVQHQNPFYQLGKLYVYRLEVELFQYASEKIYTGMPAIDAFKDIKSQDVTVNPNVDVVDSFGDNNAFKNGAANVFSGETNIFGDVVYRKTP